MNRPFKFFGKYLFYLLVSVSMAACGDDDDNPAPAVTSDFSFAADAVSPGKINFTNNAANATAYLWDFGDGTTSTLASPSHTYTSNGAFEVTLTASSSEGSGKLPGKTGGSGKTATKTVTVSNAVVVPSITASMQGAGNFTYTASSVTGTRSGSYIFVRGTSSSGIVMEIRLPASAVAGSTHSVTQSSTASSLAYTTSTNTWTAGGTACSSATGSIKVNAISATSITGTFSGTIYNPTCNGLYTIQSANFTAKF